MEEGIPRLIRLTAILTQLQSKRIITAKNIADKFNVSKRTVYRDIKALEQSGIPIVTEEGKGYSIMNGYKLTPIMFTQEEANALITAEQLIRKNKDQSLVEQYENAVTKIKAVFKNNLQEKTELLADRIQVRNNLESEKTSSHLIQLQSAISNFQLVKISYLSLEDNKSQRELEPFAVFTTKNNWILIAFCRSKNDFRAFRIDCIQELNLLNSHFDPHKITLQQYLDECGKKW